MSEMICIWSEQNIKAKVMKKLLIASLCSLGLASAFFLAVDTNKGFTVASGGGYVNVKI